MGPACWTGRGGRCRHSTERPELQTALATFAFVRLLPALPVTPGGIGVVELALTSMLCAGLDGPTAAKATAAVLLFRTITYLLPIPLGAAAYLTWQNNTSWRMAPSSERPSAVGTEPPGDRAKTKQPQ